MRKVFANADLAGSLCSYYTGSLRREKMQYLQVLARLGKCEGEIHCQQFSHIIPELCRELQRLKFSESRDFSHIRSILLCFASFAQDNYCASMMLENGVHQKLLEALGEGLAFPELARLLLELTSSPLHFLPRALLARTDLLVEAARGSQQRQRVHLVGTICQMMQWKDAHSFVVSSGALSLLSESLNDGSPTLRQAASGAICLLSEKASLHPLLMGERCFKQILLASLCETDDTVQRNLATIFHRLSSRRDRKLANHLHKYPLLVPAMLCVHRSKEESVRAEIFASIANLAYEDSFLPFLPLVFQQVSLLQSRSEEVKSLHLQFLSNTVSVVREDALLSDLFSLQGNILRKIASSKPSRNSLHIFSNLMERKVMLNHMPLHKVSEHLLQYFNTSDLSAMDWKRISFSFEFLLKNNPSFHPLLLSNTNWANVENSIEFSSSVRAARFFEQSVFNEASGSSQEAWNSFFSSKGLSCLKRLTLYDDKQVDLSVANCVYNILQLKRREGSGLENIDVNKLLYDHGLVKWLAKTVRKRQNDQHFEVTKSCLQILKEDDRYQKELQKK